MCSNKSAANFDVYQRLTKELKAEHFEEKIAYTLKKLSIIYKFDKFGWNFDHSVEMFINDYLDNGFSNLCTVIFFRKKQFNYFRKINKKTMESKVSFEEFF